MIASPDLTEIPNLTWTRSRHFRVAPFPVTAVTGQDWVAIAKSLGKGRVTLLSLWGETDAVCMALHDAASRQVAVARLTAMNGAFPSAALHHVPAQSRAGGGRSVRTGS